MSEEKDEAGGTDAGGEYVPVEALDTTYRGTLSREAEAAGAGEDGAVRLEEGQHATLAWGPAGAAVTPHRVTPPAGRATRLLSILGASLLLLCVCYGLFAWAYPDPRGRALDLYGGGIPGGNLQPPPSSSVAEQQALEVTRMIVTSAPGYQHPELANRVTPELLADLQQRKPRPVERAYARELKHVEVESCRRAAGRFDLVVKGVVSYYTGARLVSERAVRYEVGLVDSARTLANPSGVLADGFDPSTPSVRELTVANTELKAGESTLISYEVSGADAATITDLISGVDAQLSDAGNGVVKVTPASTRGYRLTASNDEGTTVMDIFVGVKRR